MMFREKHEFAFSDSDLSKMVKWSESYANEWRNKGYFVKVSPSTTSFRVVATRALSLGQEEKE